MAEHTMGWFGWFSAAGAVILAALYVIGIYAPEFWEFSAFWTGVLALVAALGAIALYYGDDPTATEPAETRARARE